VHRQRAASAACQVIRLRLRGHLQRTRRDRTLCRDFRAGRCARPVRGLLKLPRARFLSAAAQPGYSHPGAAELDGTRGAAVREGNGRAAARRRNDCMEIGEMNERNVCARNSARDVLGERMRLSVNSRCISLRLRFLGE
jgi:hypothetical protein